MQAKKRVTGGNSRLMRAMGELVTSSSHVSHMTYPAETVLIKSHRNNGLLFILESGVVEVLKDEVQICTVTGRGQVFGELSILLGSRSRATVRCVTECQFYVIKDLKIMFSTNPKASLEMARVLALRLAWTSKFLTDLRVKFEQALAEVDESSNWEHYRELLDFWKQAEKSIMHGQQAIGITGLGYESRLVKAGETFLREGEHNGLLYVLESGTVEVRKKETALLRIAEKGAVLGEIDALLQEGHSASVSAVEDTTIREIPNVSKLFEEDPRAALQLARLIARRILQMNDYFVELKKRFHALAQLDTRPGSDRFKNLWTEGEKGLEINFYNPKRVKPQ